ncbi:MAG TPA: rhomboid family intramembrane serine protease [Phycisphaerales bacterium]|nr:rhomboid family intramembrane serine protease [Phycisphaerales bacterium]
MLFPLRTDRWPKRRPIVTQTLIALNLSIYAAGWLGPRIGAFDLVQLVQWGHFDPQYFKWWRLVTALFIHDPSSIWHVVFNMLALWVFGPPVEGRLKAPGFLGFYLMAGALANIAHMMVSPAPVIGASGAIAGVSGIFLALFPRSNVICFFLFTGSLVVVSSMWFIGLYVVVDVVRQVSDMLGVRTDNVAFMAHIAGYVYGFAVGFVLLGLKVIPREECDVFFLFKQWRRRAALRALNKGSGGAVWDARVADAGQRLKDRTTPPKELTADQQRHSEMRVEIHRLAAAHDLRSAAKQYRALLADDADAVLAEQRQLEVANQFAAEGDHASAAIAYELLLRHYPKTNSAGEVRLMLGVMYARQLHKPQRARELISAVRGSLRDDAQRRLADQLLSELPA